MNEKINTKEVLFENGNENLYQVIYEKALRCNGDYKDLTDHELIRYYGMLFVKNDHNELRKVQIECENRNLKTLLKMNLKNKIVELYYQPHQSIEMLDVKFKIVPTGCQFDEIQ